MKKFVAAIAVLTFLAVGSFLVVGNPDPEEPVAFQIDTSKLDFSSITKKMESIERVTKQIGNPLNIKWGNRV